MMQGKEKRREETREEDWALVALKMLREMLLRFFPSYEIFFEIVSC